jgi:cutinase
MLPNLILTATILSLASASPVQHSKRAACANMTVVFARGTTETGDLGTLVGPPFQSAIQSAIGSATLNMMGVPAPAYPADIPDFLAGGSASGSAAMASMVQSAMAACPTTKMVISGYRSVENL